MRHVLLIRGLPGSGKSTLARTYARHGYVHLEADQYFERAGRYQFDPVQIGAAHAWCRSQLAVALAAGRDVVVANTFTRRWEMASYYAVAACYGARVTEIVMRGCWPNVHGVPPEVVAAMAARWEA
jgi:predicted kinase